MNKTVQITVEARIAPKPSVYEALERYSHYYCYLERKLFNELRNTEITSDLRKHLKRKYIVEHEIPARLFNALWIEVTGSLSSLKALQKINIQETKSKIKKVEKQIITLEKSLSGDRLNSTQRQQKKQSKHNKHQKVLRLKGKLQKTFSENIVFGSKAFYKSQWTNPLYTEDHDLWLAEWQRRRNCHMTFLGSKDESIGNQLCQYTGESFKIRVPDNFKDYKYITVPIIINTETEKQRKYYQYFFEALNNGQAITYRFIKRENGFWYVLCSFEISNTLQTVYNGSIGVDFNSDLISTSYVNNKGNFTGFKDYKYESEDLSSNQSKAVISKIVNEIVRTAKEENKLVVIEDLDLKKCKQTSNKTTNRKVSLMQYSMFRQLLTVGCVKAGVKLHIVNPAYTSVIGKYKYKDKYGISVHTSAAIVIGRRGLGFSDKVPRQICCVLRSGEAGKWEPIYRHRHHWSHWSFVNKNFNKCLKQFNSITDVKVCDKNRQPLKFNPDLNIVPNQVAYEDLSFHKFG